MERLPESKFNVVIKFGKKLLFIFFGILTVAGQAQIVSYSNEFLKIGATARGISMGNSITTVSQGAEAVYYNPANTANLQNTLDITLTHSEYFNQAANFDYIAVTYKNDSYVIGAGFLRLGVDNIPNTLYIYNNGTFDPELITYFSVADNAAFLTFAAKSKKIESLSYGIKAKFIYRHLGGFANGYGLGIDAGISFQKGKTAYAAVIRDITGTYTGWFYDLSDSAGTILIQTGNSVPENNVEIALPSIVFGASRNLKLSSKLSALAEINLITEWSGKSNYIISTKLFSTTPQLGLELNYKNTVYVRFGAYNFQRIPYFSDSTQVKNRLNFFPSAGLGIKYKNMYLDYSFQNFANQAVDLQSHFIGIRFAPDLKKRRQK